MLLAQTEPFWQTVIQALSNNGLWVFLAVCVLAGTAKHIVQVVLRHKERIAMIDAGIQPERENAVYPVGFADSDSKRAS